jgi:hypothetical protein
MDKFPGFVPKFNISTVSAIKEPKTKAKEKRAAVIFCKMDECISLL